MPSSALKHSFALDVSVNLPLQSAVCVPAMDETEKSRHALSLIAETEQALLASSTPFVSDRQLYSLSFSRGHTLNVDHETKPSNDPGPLFFQTYPDDKLDDLCSGVVQRINNGGSDHMHDCREKHHSIDCSNLAAGWLMSMVHYAIPPWTPPPSWHRTR